jgi:hypothetical protein
MPSLNRNAIYISQVLRCALRFSSILQGVFMQMYRAPAVALVLVLAACANPQPRAPSQGQLWKQESEGLAAKYKWQMDTNKALDPIRGKVAFFSPQDITFQMLTITARPSPEEKDAILEFAKIRENYVSEQRSADETYQNPFRRISEAQRQAVSAVWADLYNGAITFGESSRKRQEIEATSNAARDSLRGALAAESAATEQTSIQRLNSYLLLQQSLQQQRQAQAVALQPNQTVRLQTTCNTIGTMMYCR